MVYPEAGWLLALLIFLARVCDVSLGTFRVLVGFRGYRVLATLISFVESVIWLLAASQVIGRLDQWYLIVAYAAGFAAGNYVGITLERMLAMGRELVRVISYRKDVALARPCANTAIGWSKSTATGATAIQCRSPISSCPDAKPMRCWRAST